MKNPKLLRKINELSEPIIDIGGVTMDLRKVERVGQLGGDSSWLRYTVYFTGGGGLKFTTNENMRIRPH